MLRRGKHEGWLVISPHTFSAWAELNEVEFTATRAGSVPGKGAALLAKRTVSNPGHASDPACLLSVPDCLILSLDRVVEHARSDREFGEVLNSLDSFGKILGLALLSSALCTSADVGQTSRGAILIFLLFQASMSCPDLPEKFGVRGAFTDYIKSLPFEVLPTFWSEPERHLLVGTSLAPAVASKLKSLHREYDLFCSSIAHTKWHHATRGHIEFEDWLQVDAMYRSRALEFPGVGHCMIPCLDLANHDPHEATIAVYEKHRDGNAMLLLRDGKTIHEGDEVTITYGDEKGACEMLFSYGFLETDRQSAETLFLDLSIPHDDMTRSAKIAIADCAPGFKIIDAGDGEIDWTGEYIWLLCVAVEDGLHFKLAQRNDGSEEEMHAFFGHHELSEGAAQLFGILGKHELWDVYRLRAVAILQQRVLEQMQVLYSTQEEQAETLHGDGTKIQDHVFEQAMQLRRLEFELLERAYEDFEKQKVELAGSAVVEKYLAAMNADEPEDRASQPPITAPDDEQLQRANEEDFS